VILHRGYPDLREQFSSLHFRSAQALRLLAALLLCAWCALSLAQGTRGSAAEAAADTALIRILAGREARGPYLDRFRNTWRSDAHFSGGEAKPGPAAFPLHPPDAGLFRTMRQGEFAYDIPVEPGPYEMRLCFAEPLYRPAIDVTNDGENQRRFNVFLNGKLILDKFDIVADAGFAPVTIRAFKDVEPAPDGKAHLKFVSAQSPQS
jgi:hypothetical protein